MGLEQIIKKGIAVLAGGFCLSCLPDFKAESFVYANPVVESSSCSEKQPLEKQPERELGPTISKTVEDYRLDGTVLSKLPKDGTNKIAITIDDCYNLDVLKGILDAFVEHNKVMQSVIPDYKASMTLFPVGELIKREKYLELFKRAEKEGHDIANHTFTHKNLTAVSDEVIKEEITKTNQLLKEKLGIECYILRVPYGAINTTVIEIAKENEIKYIIQWNKYGRDAEKKENGDSFSAQDCFTLIKDFNGCDIFLFHSNKEESLTAIKYLLYDIAMKNIETFSKPTFDPKTDFNNLIYPVSLTNVLK